VDRCFVAGFPPPQVVNDAKMKYETFSNLSNGNNTSAGDSEPPRRLRAAASQSESLPSPGERHQHHRQLHQQQQRSWIEHDPLAQSVRGWSRDTDHERSDIATDDDIEAISDATQRMMAQLRGGDVLEN